MLRFGVLQGGKIRPCDNARTSLHNLATTLFETVSLESADFPARMAALFVELLGDTSHFSVLIGTEDIASAYRRMPCSEPWFTVFAQWDPFSERVVFFRLQGFNFGLKSAVVAFNRLSFRMQRAAVRLLPLCSGSYFDDFACVEPRFAAGGQALLRRFAALLRVPFAGASLGDGKSHAPRACNTFLGVVDDFSMFGRTGELFASVPAASVEETAAVISRVLQQGSFAGTYGASKLAGKLHFTISWALHRFGRAALGPLHAAAAASGRHEAVSPLLRDALTFLHELLVDADGKCRLRPRRYRLRRRRGQLPRPTLVWSDAMWEASATHPAGIGFLVFIPDDEAASPPSEFRGVSLPRGRWRYLSFTVGSDFMLQLLRRMQYIGQLEILAAVVVYFSLARELRGRQVIHFIDNSSAMAALVKGYSSAPDSASLVHAFWAMAAYIEVDVWFEYVRSAANIADWPSRGECGALITELRATEIEPTLPPVGSFRDVERAVLLALGQDTGAPYGGSSGSASSLPPFTSSAGASTASRKRRAR